MRKKTTKVKYFVKTFINLEFPTEIVVEITENDSYENIVIEEYKFPFTEKWKL